MPRDFAGRTRPGRSLSVVLLTGLFASVLGIAQPAHAAESLRTLAEQSRFTRTGDYAEVIRLCDAFAERWPDAVRCETFGTTPEGRPMKLLVVSTSGALTPEAAAQRQLPVVLAQGGIHAGEIDGKDAVFWLLPELLDGKVLEGVLDRQVLLFVPVFNVDGHERRGPNNRPNQVGPEEMGWRTTAQNLNLNRDYAKAEAPEMQAMLALMRAWDPWVLADLHVTDGAKFEHDVSITAEPVNSGDEAVRADCTALRDGILADLTEEGSLPLAFYPSFVVPDDPASGFADGVMPPRFSTGYMPYRNRCGILVETHSWKDYKTRVRITRNSVESILSRVAETGAAWRAEALAADDRSAQLGGMPVALDYLATDNARVIDFRGYAYTRTPSAVSGVLMTRYDDRHPEIWRIPLRDEVEATLMVPAPPAGYVIPAQWASFARERLDAHGIRWQRIGEAQAMAARVFRADDWDLSPGSFEGHQLCKARGEWAREEALVSAGSLFVPIDQPLARLVMALLEPQAPDSWVSWGYFNNVFETKEYMEDYVAEDVAEAALAKDPALAAEFAAKLDSDAEFRANPQARLKFFADRHGSHDDRLGLYPILRVKDVPAGLDA